MSDDSASVLNIGLQLAGWTTRDLWIAAAGVGGTMTERDVEAIVARSRGATPQEHDILAAGLNDHFTARGEDHPVPYWRELAG